MSLTQTSLRKLFFITLLLACLGCCAQNVRPALRVDTGAVAAMAATAEKEKEVFSDKDFQYKTDASESKNWLEAFWDWFLSLIEEFFGKLSPTNAQLAWQIFKWTLIGLFIAGIVFVLWKSNFHGLLRGKPKSLAGAAFSDLPEDLESVNIDKLINDALAAGNYRLAIRWCFLKSLQLLNHRKHIVWQPSKTNIDYQHELKSAGLREEFRKLSYVFEYVWYGEMATNEGVFASYRKQADQFNGNLDA
jgi:hypothetical protein